MTNCNTSPNFISQLPGELNLDMVDDNDLVFAINWNMDITGYTFQGNIIPKNILIPLIPLSIEIIDAITGRMNVIITSTSITGITPSTNRWHLDWITPAPEEYVRTVLSGVIVLRTK